MNTTGEDFAFALFCVVALHHPNAAQRFGEPTGDFRIQFRSRPEKRPDGLEGSV